MIIVQKIQFIRRNWKLVTEKNTTQTRTLKVEILEKNRCTISMRDIKPYDRQKFDYTKNKDKIMGIYMRTRSYVRNLKSFHKKLWDLHFDNGNYYLITLTFNDEIQFRYIEQRLRTFRTALKRRYGKFEYVRAIELTKQHSYHIHMIVQFIDFPLDLNKNNIEALWKLGICDIKQAYDLRGGIQYITKYKENSIHYSDDEYLKPFKSAIQKRDKYLTYFPKNANLFAKSDNFGKETIDNETKKIVTTKEKFKNFLDYLKERNKQIFTRIDGHNYLDKDGKQRYCMDKLYIRGSDIEELLKILAS